MAFFGSSWNDDQDELDKKIGPLSQLLEDLEEWPVEDMDPGEKGADDNIGSQAE